MPRKSPLRNNISPSNIKHSIKKLKTRKHLAVTGYRILKPPQNLKFRLTHSLQSLTPLTPLTHSLHSLTPLTHSLHSLTPLTHSTHSLHSLHSLTHSLTTVTSLETKTRQCMVTILSHNNTLTSGMCLLGL